MREVIWPLARAVLGTSLLQYGEILFRNSVEPLNLGLNKIGVYPLCFHTIKWEKNTFCKTCIWLVLLLFMLSCMPFRSVKILSCIQVTSHLI